MVPDALIVAATSPHLRRVVANESVVPFFPNHRQPTTALASSTIPIKASPYDWNTTLTVTSKPDSITLVIAPASVFAHQQTVRLEPSRITTIVAGPGAWQRVAEVSGAQLPANPPTLFGLLQNHGFLGILYQDDNGKPAAILLDSTVTYQIGRILEALIGKPLEYAK